MKRNVFNPEITQKYEQQLNELSELIKRIEKECRKYPIYAVSLNTGDFILTFNNGRLVFREECFERPLIECNVATRLRAKPFLMDFVEAYQNKIKEVCDAARN